MLTPNSNSLFLDDLLDCECTFCFRKPVIPAAANKIIARLELRLRQDQSPPKDALHILKMLARSNEPLPASTFENYLSLDARGIKSIMRELRDEWLLPVCATRKPPYGYFIAARPDQIVEWMRVTRSQAISELGTAYKIFRANFPDLAGQKSFDFVQLVSDELQHEVKEAA